MKRHRSWPSVSALSLASMLIIGACQTQLSPPPETSPTKQKTRPTPTPASNLRPQVEPASLQGVSVEIWHPWDGVEGSLLEAQVAEFNQQNEWGVTARATSFSGYTELYSSLTEALPAGDAPQLAIALPEHLVSWNLDDYVLELDDYVQDPAYGIGSNLSGEIPDVFWNQDVVAGVRIGIPAQRSARFLIYNQTWADELGFDTAPRDETEFREQACAANAALKADDDQENDGQGGWLVDTDSWTFLSWMMAFGGGVLDGSSYRFLGPRNLEALAFVKQLYDDGCAWLPQADETASSAFASRSALVSTASLEDLSEHARAMAEAQNPDVWTVLSFPGPVQPGLVAYGSSFGILKSTPEQQLASWLFVRWMLQPKIQERWVEATGLFPLHASVTTELADYARSHPQWAAALEYIPEAQIQPQLASWRQIRIMLGDGFDAMFRTNTAAGRVAEILAIMDRTANDLNP